MYFKLYRFDKKLIALWVILILQLILVTSYILLSPILSPQNTQIDLSVKFLDQITNIEKSSQNHQCKQIKLKYERTSDFYFNSSSIAHGCYIEGTDVLYMQRNDINSSIAHNCICFSQWHGNDCSQPEVIWRALLTSKQKIEIKRPRLKLKRMIYMFNISATAMAEVVINELLKVIDLFIIYGSQKASTFKSSNKILLRENKDKIFYISAQNSTIKKIWNTIESKIINLRIDDYLIYMKSDEILNKRALQFLKLYDCPQPLLFRLKWTVYGYFWQHPILTKTVSSAISINNLREVYSGDPELVRHISIENGQLKTNEALTIGDLNHYGGWFCEYCTDPSSILTEILTVQKLKEDDIINANGKLDVSYIEDLITAGIHIDGKTTLKKLYRFRDKYFAPNFITETSWKYDWLLTNIYSKSDEY